LNAVGCDLYLEKQAVDTTTPAGRALFQMLGVFAEFERAILQERIHAGIARARRNGTKSGKAIGHPRVSAKLEATIRAFSAVGRRHSQDGKGVRCRGWHSAADQARHVRQCVRWPISDRMRYALPSATSPQASGVAAG
jgi:DNA invertase Pin-like site-specific DNA recombinase